MFKCGVLSEGLLACLKHTLEGLLAWLNWKHTLEFFLFKCGVLKYTLEGLLALFKCGVLKHTGHPLAGLVACSHVEFSSSSIHWKVFLLV